MTTVRIQGSATGTGVVTIQAPASDNSPVLTFPVENTTIVGTDNVQTLVNKTLGPGTVMGTSVIDSDAEVATTSGTTVVLATSIPTWATIVTVAVRVLSTSGTSPIIVQFGTVSGFVTSGYISAGDNYSATPGPVLGSTAGFRIGSAYTAATTTTILCTFMRVGVPVDPDHRWVGSYNGINDTGNGMVFGGGSVTLAESLSQIRITTEGGTDTFDGGSISVSYQ